MNPTLTLDGCIYMLTVGSILTTNAIPAYIFQSYSQSSCLPLLLEWTTLTAYPWQSVVGSCSVKWNHGIECSRVE